MVSPPLITYICAGPKGTLMEILVLAEARRWATTAVSINPVGFANVLRDVAGTAVHVGLGTWDIARTYWLGRARSLQVIPCQTPQASLEIPALGTKCTGTTTPPAAANTTAWNRNSIPNSKPHCSWLACVVRRDIPPATHSQDYPEPQPAALICMLLPLSGDQNSQEKKKDSGPESRFSATQPTLCRTSRLYPPGLRGEERRDPASDVHEVGGQTRCKCL